jgi:hypothetical protein
MLHGGASRGGAQGLKPRSRSKDLPVQYDSQRYD